MGLETSLDQVPLSIHGCALAPLLTRVNSCRLGIGVVNIDRGFGAPILAAQIFRTYALKRNRVVLIIGQEPGSLILPLLIGLSA